MWQIARNPYLLNHVFDEDVYWKQRVGKEFGFSSGLQVIDISALLPDFRQTVSPYAFLDGSSTPADLALLRGLAEKHQVASYLEIGTWRGESVANMAPLVEQAVSINLPDDEMRSMGLDEDYIGMHRFFSKDLNNVQHIQANSLTFDFASLGKKFDMVFIDGSHHFDAVKSDSMHVAQIIDPEKSIVVWHDYGRNPEQIRWSVLAGILSGFPPELWLKLYHVSNTMCAVYLPDLPDGVEPYALQANVAPKNYFEVTVRAVKGE